MHAKSISLSHLISHVSLSPSPPLSLSPPSLFLSIYMHATTIPHCNAGPLQLSKMVPETDKERREHVIDVSPCIGQT